MTKRKYLKNYYIKNRKKILARSKKYQQQHRVQTRKRTKQWYVDNRSAICKRRRRARKENYSRFLLAEIKQGAKEKRIPFNLTTDDILMPKICPVLRYKLVVNSGHPKDNSPSIDRIIPSKGYVKGNVEIISHKANSMKRNANPKELKLFCNYYLKKFSH